ncbi:MAG: ribonuclease P protein component 4 [Candidatus Bathyarchaeia archaeon]
MEALFELAVKVFPKNRSLAQRYVEIARRIGMRYKVRLPKTCRRLLCRGCKGLMLPGQNCRVRLRSKGEPHVVITCLTCGRITRIPLRAKRKSKALNQRGRLDPRGPPLPSSPFP